MKKWATLSCNYPTCHLCVLWFSCNNLLTTFFKHAYHPWCIGEYTTFSHCVVHFCNLIFITNWCATWGLKLHSKDVQGRVGMKIEGNMVQSLPMETPSISFANGWNTLLNTFCCLHVYVIYFHSFVCFVSRSMVFNNQISTVLF
jgi:hypothetical protein